MATLLDFSLRNELAHVVEPLRRLTATARELNVDLFVVGAVARDVAFYSWGMVPERGTSDLDIAVVVPDWPSYAALRDRFDRLDGPAAHRVEVAGVQVDLVPFGGVERPAGQIAWPPDETVVMSVLGFAEARRAAVHVRLAPDVQADFASVPGLMALKLVAWTERRWSRPRTDSVDLGHLLRAQGEPWNFERIYGPDPTALDECGDDVILAGAWLLGSDVRALFDPPLVAHLLTILDGQSSVDSLLIRHMQGSAVLNVELLRAFRQGLAWTSGHATGG